MSNQHFIIDVTERNLSDHPQTICFINPKHPFYSLKLDWLRVRYREGLKIKLLYVKEEKRPVGFLEYVPGENCWRAVSAKGYLFVHCLWINGTKYKNKGLGSILLNECIEDAKKGDYFGIAAMTSFGPFIADKTVFEKNGFSIADTIPGKYELMVKSLKHGPMPTFNDWQQELRKYKGLYMVYSRQCPWVARFIMETGEKLRSQGIKLTITELVSPLQAQQAPSPYAVFNLIHDGKLLADHYISETRFMNILKKEKLV